MTNKEELNKEELEEVTGGDCDDYKSEWGLTPEEVKYRYQVGQEVEVYQTGLHASTKRKKIEDRRPYSYKGGWVGEYKFQTGENLITGEKEYTWYLADQIES